MSVIKEFQVNYLRFSKKIALQREKMAFLDTSQKHTHKYEQFF